MSRRAADLSRAGRIALVTALAAVGALAGAPARARACAACGCGDPTLVVMGAEQPFAGRMRLAGTLRHRADRIGAGQDRVLLRETRLELSASWSPVDWLALSATMPIVHRALDLGDGPYGPRAPVDAFSPGDLEVRARIFVFRDRALSPRHLLAVQAGLGVPTGATRALSNEIRLPQDALAGLGAWSPIAGVSYAFFDDPWSFYASAVTWLRIGGHDGERPGEQVRLGATLQRQLGAVLALRAAADLRVDAATRLEDGARDPNSGGAILYAGPDLVLSPLTDLLVVVGLRVPVVQGLRGAHVERAIAELSVAGDL